MVSYLVCPRSTQLLTLSNKFDGQSCCSSVSIYLEKSFDTRDHELLVEKRNVYDIRGVANKWLQNYLTNRKQYVMIYYHSSDLLDNNNNTAFISAPYI